MAKREDDEPATVVGRGLRSPSEPPRRAPVESPTRRVDSLAGLSSPTRAMPSGYGMSRFVPPPRPSVPRPAAGRPAVPSVVDDPTSESEMTLIERIDAEVESITSELSIPEGLDASLLDEPSGGGAEATIRMPVPDDLPSDLLDAESEPGTAVVPRRPRSAPSLPGLRPGTPLPAPSLSSMPTPALGTLAPVGTAPPPDPPVAAAAPPSLAVPPSQVAARRPAPAPAWVGPYVVLCLVVTLMGVLALAYLKVERHW